MPDLRVPVDTVTTCRDVRAHRELTRIVLAVVVEALMSNPALHGEQIQINAFGLHPAIAQRLQIVVAVVRDRQFRFRHITPLLS